MHVCIAISVALLGVASVPGMGAPASVRDRLVFAASASVRPLTTSDICETDGVIVLVWRPSSLALYFQNVAFPTHERVSRRARNVQSTCAM